MSALHGLPSQHQTMPSHSLCDMLLQLLVVQQLLVFSVRQSSQYEVDAMQMMQAVQTEQTL